MSDIYNPNPETTKKILSFIKQNKPKSRNYFKFLNAGKIIAFFTGIAISSLALAVFFYDGVIKLSLLGLGDFSFGEVVSGMFLELIPLIILIIFGLYFLYKQSDWIFVKNLKSVLLGIIITVLMFTGILVTQAASENDVAKIFTPVDNTLNLLNRLPYRQRASLWNKLTEREVFIGRIQSINTDDYILVVSSNNKSEPKTLSFELPKLGFRKFRVGQVVVLKYEDQNGVLKVKRSRILRLQTLFNSDIS